MQFVLGGCGEGRATHCGPCAELRGFTWAAGWSLLSFFFWGGGGSFWFFFSSWLLPSSLWGRQFAAGGLVGRREPLSWTCHPRDGKGNAQNSKSFLASCGASTVCSASQEGVSARISLRGAGGCSRGKYLRQQHNSVVLGCSETPQLGSQPRQADRAAQTHFETRNEVRSARPQRQWVINREVTLVGRELWNFIKGGVTWWSADYSGGIAVATQAAAIRLEW